MKDWFGIMKNLRAIVVSALAKFCSPVMDNLQLMMDKLSCFCDFFFSLL